MDQTSTILPPKPDARLRIYAYSIPAESHDGLLKVGQTIQDVKTRVAQQTKTVGVAARIELDESAERPDGSVFTDHQVRAHLAAKGFPVVKPSADAGREWVRCTLADVQTAIAEIRAGVRYSGTHHETFEMRKEQKRAVRQTADYFWSRWDEDADAVPRFLWNAKMRFGKTFTAYQLAREIGAKKVLVVTFKPAVEDAWQTDLESHVDFDGWQYASKASGVDPTELDQSKPIVYFGSFQDLLGKDKSGAIKAKNEWLHTTNWDLVVFDEYHFGAWRDTAKELFEGEDEAVIKKAMKVEYADGLEEVND
ncbi:MAG: DEAD/DEAH box helicase family protein, partial [Rhodococcus sp.]|nr:DEAD/DEAH box helicase family protein [Rhodococcus sp. (in: high G+C Gram-positive bacteria)]